MNRLLPIVASLRSIQSILSAGVVLGGLALSALAEPPKSVLPVFGTTGREIQPRAKDGYDIRGWLPKDWVDNSSWAPVSVMYSQLKDAPEVGVGAVRLEIMKVDAFHVQMTTKEGAHPYKQGKNYVLTGWVRSTALTPVWVGFRQDEEPKDYLAAKDLDVDTEWKRVSLEWTPERDSNAWLIFNFQKVGVVDLAGIALEEKP